MKTDVKIFLSDLSFCELIIGCRNINDLKYHYNELNDMDFVICGMNESLDEFLSEQNIEKIKTEEEFFGLKKEY